MKFRSSAGSPAEEVALKEAIVIKNADTQKVLEARFVPQPDSDRLDREIQNKQLANLLQFYLDRCKRHGLIAPQMAEAADLQNVIRAVTEGSFEVGFERAGFIYNLQGTSKPPETYKENRIFVVGSETIRELLDIPVDIEPPAVVKTPPEPPPSQPPAPPIATIPLTQKGKAIDYRDTEEAEVIRVKAAEGEKKAVTPTEPSPAKPVRKPERPIPSSESVIRIPLGKNCDTKKDVYWDPFTTTPKKLANQHVLIVGKSGAGKTQSAAAFMVELWKAKIPSVIFDFQGEYMDPKLANANDQTFLECTQAEVLDAADGIAVNPLEVPEDPHTAGGKQNFMKVVYQVSTSLAKIFGLGDIQRAMRWGTFVQSVPSEYDNEASNSLTFSLGRLSG